MRILIPLFLLVIVLMPLPALAADATFFGPIIPPECNCEEGEVRTAADYGCVLATVQNGMNFAISISIIIMLFYMVLIGFQFITSAGNPSAREAARKRVMNLVFGFLLLLGAWLLVDFIMKTLYKEDASAGSVTLGPWNSILGATSDAKCLKMSPPPPALPEVVGIETPSTGTGTGVPAGDGSFPRSEFTYQSGIAAQIPHASADLSNFLTCVAGRVPDGVGNISSISDSRIVNGSRTWEYCAANGCAHSARSCHYGGRSCVGQSYAVDFGDEQNKGTLMPAARACGASFVLDEGDHVHASVSGSRCGCN